MPATSAYAELESRFRRLAALEGASSMLYWDQSAMMPPGGAKARASQDAKGVITPAAAPVTAPPAGDSSTQAAPAQAEAAKPPAAPAAAKEPPVNVERLRFADSIETPIPERGSKK